MLKATVTDKLVAVAFILNKKKDTFSGTLTLYRYGLSSQLKPTSTRYIFLILIYVL